MLQVQLRVMEFIRQRIDNILTRKNVKNESLIPIKPASNAP
uniref:Uncharacterized protein n=1 Tax=Yersinia ruckeri TaxID=29486 RepID=A0A0A8VJH8_YERRU|nr:hypothetical protein CSF007_14080 [Yersinia ruckeri]